MRLIKMDMWVYLQVKLRRYVSSLNPCCTCSFCTQLKHQVASIGIHLRHRITSHGFAINITPEPKAWFDLVTACGLADMRAVSIHDLLDRQGHSSKPSVADAARDIRARFGKVYGREMVSLDSPVEAEERSEVEELREIVGRAEEEAGKMNKEKGGWMGMPDNSKDSAR